jgi:hypothetical protein
MCCQDTLSADRKLEAEVEMRTRPYGPRPRLRIFRADETDTLHYRDRDNEAEALWLHHKHVNNVYTCSLLLRNVVGDFVRQRRRTIGHCCRTKSPTTFLIATIRIPVVNRHTHSLS